MNILVINYIYNSIHSKRVINHDRKAQNSNKIIPIR